MSVGKSERKKQEIRQDRYKQIKKIKHDRYKKRKHKKRTEIKQNT